MPYIQLFGSETTIKSFDNLMHTKFLFCAYDTIIMVNSGLLTRIALGLPDSATNQFNKSTLCLELIESTVSVHKHFRF